MGMGTLETEIWGVGDGWLLAELGEMHVGYSDARAGKEAQLAYQDCQERAIIETHARGGRRCVMNHAPSPTNLDPVARKRFAEILKEQHDRLKDTTALFVLVTPSTIARGITTAVLWLAPPPYPYAIRADVSAGLEVIQRTDERIDAALYAREYAELIRAHVPGAEAAA